MTSSASPYDRRYLAGILFFNRRDFFEAHEVWEDLWADTPGQERRFFQALIQAAVALHHFGNGNLRGAIKLYKTSRAYMERFGPFHLGLDIAGFWRQMESCFAVVHAQSDLLRDLRPDEVLIPTITLEPPPVSWPDLAEFPTPNT